MKKLQGPFPSPGFREQISANVLPPLIGFYSGEVTTSIGETPIGAVHSGGRISSVWMSVRSCGQDDSNTLKIEADVYLNGVSCLSTKPAISYVSGEAASQKTTVVTGDTGITQAVLDSTNIDVDPGDVLTFDLTLTRTATPAHEITHPCVVVEIQPR
ncbi:hypothetical protein DRO30_03610 [Candidatus Bathyarchaeota archaeon]|nr:MAG: hypothetical protein DRO30_03610 [Candidatus Bathyarchaeota archaeon]